MLMISRVKSICMDTV